MKNNRYVGLRKGAWSKEEDALLKKCVEMYGEGKWHLVPLRAGLNRCRKSCRLRWLDYLKPNIKKGSFAKDEVDLIKRLHKLLGNRWSLIAGRLPGRTANGVKNFWNTHFEKKIASAVEETKVVKKTITKTNIIKPTPFRLFSRSNVPKSTEIIRSDTNETNAMNNDDEILRSHTNETNVTKNDDENTNNIHPVFRDECIEWWSNLLHATSETKEKLGTSNLIQENEDGRLHHGGVKIGLHDGENLNPLDNQDASTDVDLWKLLSFDN